MADTATARRLHGRLPEPDGWWACAQPERPPDGLCVYDRRCAKCRLKATADLAHDPDMRVVNLHNHDNIERLADVLAEVF